MASVGGISIDVALELARLNEGVATVTSRLNEISGASDKASNTLKSLSASSDESASHLQNMAASVADVVAALKAIAGVAVFHELVGVIGGVLEKTESLAETSKKLGVGVEGYQALSYAAGQLGVSQEDLNRSLAKFEVTIGQAEAGIGAGAKAFQELGLSQAQAKQLGSEPLDKALGQISDRLNALPDPSQRAAAAMAVFGRGWQTTGALILEGSKGIEQLTQRARDLGIVLSEDDVRAGEEAEKQFKTLSAVISSDLMRAVVSIAPELEQFARDLAEAAQGVSVIERGGILPDLSGADKAQLEKQLSVIDESKTRIQAKLDEAQKSLTSRFVASLPDVSLFGGHAGVGSDSDIAHYKDTLAQLDLESKAIRSRIAEISGQGPPPAPIPTEGLINPSARKPKTGEGTAEGQQETFSRDYTETLRGYQEEIDYQKQLAVAYGTSADAVQKLQIQHAGDAAELKLLTEAEREHVTATQAQLAAVGAAAEGVEKQKLAADEAKKAAEEQADFAKSFTEQLSGIRESASYYQQLTQAEQQGKAAVDALAVSHAGDLAVQKSLNDALRDHITLSQQDAAAIRGAAEAEEAQKQAAQAAAGVDKSDDEIMKQLISTTERGASSFLEAATSEDRQSEAHGRHAHQVSELQKAYEGLLKDIEKVILQYTVLNPLMNALGGSLDKTYKPQPTLEGSPIFQRLLGGGGAAVAAPVGPGEQAAGYATAFQSVGIPTVAPEELKASAPDLTKTISAGFIGAEKDISKVLGDAFTDAESVISRIFADIFGGGGATAGAAGAAGAENPVVGAVASAAGNVASGAGAEAGKAIANAATGGTTGAETKTLSPGPPKESPAGAGIGSEIGSAFSGAASELGKWGAGEFENWIGGGSSPDIGAEAEALGSGLEASGIPAFASGGKAEVLGAGGPDSQLAQFKVTPGETISVATPFQWNAAPNLTSATEKAAGVKVGGVTTAATATNAGAPLINIYNNHPSAGVDAQPTQNGQGVDIIVSNMMARDVHTGGPFARSMQNVYGLSRTPVGR